MPGHEEPLVKYVEGVVTSLIGKLGQLLVEEYQLLAGVRGKIANLRDDVAIMNALLRMHSDSEANEGAVNHLVLEWMKQVRELAYDAEDGIDTFVRRISHVPRGTWWIDHQWYKLLKCLARHHLATNVKDLRARALAVAERRRLYGIDGASVSSGQGGAPSTRVLRIANDPNQFVGIAEQVNTLSEIMTPNQPNGQTLKLLSIVGPAGVGKTTLALEFCRRNVETFPCPVIVSASHAFDADRDLKGLLKCMLQRVANFGNIDAMDEATLTNMFGQQLSDKRYLVVIDDVWTVPAWHAILTILPAENYMSSRIIVTTRTETVARACSSPSLEGYCIHNANPLDEENSERLFLDRAFGINENCPEVLIPQMNIILGKCAGLPLAITKIASVLAGYRSPEMWERICRSMGSQMDMNPTLEGMMQVIALSYNNLPHHLKACMMYLSIFPEGYEISKRRLLRRWIAEGFIPEKRGVTSHEVAQDYLDELLRRNVIQSAGAIVDQQVRPLAMKLCHDMMLKVIVSKSLEANFVSFVGNRCGRRTSYDTVRRLSIQGELAGSGADEMSMPHVRSLSSFGFLGQGKLVDRLGEFTLLRVLDLEDCKDVHNHHLKQICRLFLISFLNLNETDITVLPSEISNLEHLQTLWLYDTLFQMVPESVTNLKKLEHMSFRNRARPEIYLRLPPGLDKMKALQVLHRLELRQNDVQIATEIGELEQLQELGIVLNRCSEAVLVKLAMSLLKIKRHSLRYLYVEMGGEAAAANDAGFLGKLASFVGRIFSCFGYVEELPAAPAADQLNFLSTRLAPPADFLPRNQCSATWGVESLRVSLIILRPCFPLFFVFF